MSIESSSEMAIFERLVWPSEPPLSEEAARSLLAVEFGSTDAERMHVLAEKARRGTLTPEEQREADNYERVGHYLAILQSKARIALGRSTDADT
ncbi:MAG: hypothetical protein DWQ37_23175 [Planctomycetota bacterium]|nr:MAG: hypothetical protein DWQ37_23175 [Planctomycetota bacterium]